MTLAVEIGPPLFKYLSQMYMIYPVCSIHSFPFILVHSDYPLFRASISLSYRFYHIINYPNFCHACWSCKLYNGRTHHSLLFSIVRVSARLSVKNLEVQVFPNLSESLLCSLPFADTVPEPLQSSRHSRNLTKSHLKAKHSTRY